MEQLVDRVAGLDVHRDTVVATVRRPRPGGGRLAKTLTFATTVAELTALGEWLVAEGVELAGMESTGVYWKPVYFLLEERIPRVWLLNAEHLHNVPGRKTDVADSPGSLSCSSTAWWRPASCRRRRSGSCGI